ncbi:MAG: hypothetical protein ACYDAD_12855 [Acidimicrobiales bacterium]
MVLWPAGMGVLFVWLVFRDPALDQRLVILGALLPDAVDGPFGGARILHTLALSVIVLMTVMVLTRSRRRSRRRWLALPIGLFVHLLLDGMWASTHTFWWPAFGWSLSQGLPSLDHGLAVLLLEELAGAGALAWCAVRFGLGDPVRRDTFLRTGRVGLRGLSDREI